MIDEVLKTTESKMVKTVEAMGKDFVAFRTGRATPGLVDNVRVDYYGAPTPISQLASISAPEARLLVIQPWDRITLPLIEKAIMKSDLGLNPSSDGSAIRLAIPQLTEERRKELVKLVKKRVEEGHIAVRNVRREGLEKLRNLQRNKEISEDDEKRSIQQLQKLTDSYIEKTNQMGKTKESEVLEI